MRAKKPFLAGLLAGLLTVTLTPIGPAAAQPPNLTADSAATPTAAASRTITLVTGDRVTIVDGDTVAVDRGEGRDHVGFITQRVDEHHYVIPSDAIRLVGTGQLDRRLFDVTLLQESGYDDVRANLPLIVTADAPAEAEQSLPEEGATVIRDLPAVDGVAVQVDKDETGEFWEGITAEATADTPRTLVAGVATVWLDGVRQPLLDESVPQVGAPAAWAAGLDGTGSKVAVLDTGIDANHPDLADQIIAQENFTEDPDDRDVVGHGTHVASIVAGTGAASDGQFQGVAPGASLLDGKVCEDVFCTDSAILAGMQWAAEQGADVVNMSLGGPPFPDDPLVEAVERLTDEFGVLFVIAAGNSGSDDGTVESPGVASSALTVGAVDKADELAEFSSRGPTPDGALKPDLTAPGVDIVAANSADGFLGEPGEPYTTLSGTSMATPHAAGAAAILAQQHPDWSPGQLKATLMGSASTHPELGPFAQGAGRLDVARAIGQDVTTGPASISFDRPLWPHDDDEPQTRTITYQNTGSEDVTLELAAAATGPDGEPAPDGFFALSDTSVTVPAGGTAEVSLVVDTVVGDVDGLFGGYVTSTGPDDLVVTTPFGVDREVESHNVTLVHTDRNGDPTSDYDTLLLGGDPFQFVSVFGEPEVTVRVPAGQYFLGSYLFPAEGDESGDLTLLVYPVLGVTEDLTLAIDARLGEPVSVGVHDRKAVPTHTGVDAVFLGEEFGVGLGASVGSEGTLFTAQLGPAGPQPGMATTVAGGLAVPARDGSLEASRKVYNVAWVVEGEFVTGFDRTARRADLATVKADHGRQVEGAQGVKYAIPLHPEFGGGGSGLPISLPIARTEYFNTDGGVEWVSLFDEFIETEEIFEIVIFLDGDPTTYRAGRTYHERWNYGVFGPVLAFEGSGAVRFDNELAVVPDLYGDGAGHWGFSPSTGSITIFRDGELIHEEPFSDFAVVEVPPELARYRVEVEAERAVPAPLSTQTSLAWEFESARVDEESLVQLPLSVVRFSPKLRPDNTARAGSPFLVPVRVEPAPGADTGKVMSLTVEVSYDDGATWRREPVFAGKVLLWHPRGDGFVSLRATATDKRGNSVEQTVIRAYEIR